MTDLLKRYEDMSSQGHILIMIQDGGDVILSIIQDPDDMVSAMPSVEFCSPGSGGGQSPHTRKALVELYKAVLRDNTESRQTR